MKRIVSLMMVLVMCVSLIASLSVPVLAAKSGGANTKTIYVTTKANWSYPGQESITLKQEKAKFTYTTWNGKTKSGSFYPSYNITIKNNTTGKSDTKYWSSRSIKLKLDRNCSYTITVSYDSNGSWLGSGCKLGTYTSGPYWWVSNTHKATCS